MNIVELCWIKWHVDKSNKCLSLFLTKLFNVWTNTNTRIENTMKINFLKIDYHPFNSINEPTDLETHCNSNFKRGKKKNSRLEPSLYTRFLKKIEKEDLESFGFGWIVTWQHFFFHCKMNYLQQSFLFILKLYSHVHIQHILKIPKEDSLF